MILIGTHKPSSGEIKYFIHNGKGDGSLYLHKDNIWNKWCGTENMFDTWEEVGDFLKNYPDSGGWTRSNGVDEELVFIEEDEMKI